jgi:hypothetical protein
MVSGKNRIKVIMGGYRWNWHQKIFIEVHSEAKWQEFVCLTPHLNSD